MTGLLSGWPVRDQNRTGPCLARPVRDSARFIDKLIHRRWGQVAIKGLGGAGHFGLACGILSTCCGSRTHWRAVGVKKALLAPG